MVLIPALLDDLARECLARVNYSQFPIISSVCKAWKSELQWLEFYLFRKKTCNIQKLIIVPHHTFLKRTPITPVQVTFLEPETGVWRCLPPVPDIPNCLPLEFCSVVSCITSFILLVGLYSDDKQCDTYVFVFDFLSSNWRGGAKLSGMYPVSPPNGCRFDGDHMVYALCRRNRVTESRSLVVYDTVNDNWTTLSDMSSVCDRGYRAIFHHGKIHIACEGDEPAESTWRNFDVSTLQWNLSEEKFINSLELFPHVCEDNGEWYGCSYEDDVSALRGSTWKAIAKLPTDMRYSKFVTLWKRKLVVIGVEEWSWPQVKKASMLDLKDHEWTTVETPAELRYIRSACAVEI